MEIEHKSSTNVETRCAQHPERSAVGTCGRCGNYYCDACTGRRDDERGYCTACYAARGYVAWEDGSLGWWQRYHQTVRSSVLQLPRFADELPREGGVARALSFALIPTSITIVLGALFMAAFTTWLGAKVAVANDGTPVSTLLLGGLTFLMTSASALFGFLAYLVAWPALLLGISRMFGVKQLSYRGAFRCLCYASGLNWMLVIPLIGLAAAIYHFVVAAVCIGAMSRGSMLMGFAIYGVPTFLCGMGSCGAYMAFIWAAATH